MITKPHHRMTRTAAAAGTAALLAVALTGCIKLDMDLTLDGDRADGHMIFAMDKESLALMEQMQEDLGEVPQAPPTDPDALMDEFVGDDFDDIDGATVEPWEDDRYVGTRVTFEQVDLAEMESGGDDSLRISYDAEAGTYEVTGRMDLSDMDGMETGDPAGAEDMGLPEGFAEQLLESFDLRISITFPGEVQEHTGELSGTTVTWQPAVGEDTEIYALASATGADEVTDAGDAEDRAGLPDAQEAAASGDGPGVLTAVLLGLGVLMLASGAVIGIWLVRRNRQPAAAQPPAPPQQ